MKIYTNQLGPLLYLTVLLLVLGACKNDDPEPTYALTVLSGSGSGNYAMNTVVNIAANTAGANQEFDQWIGDVSGIADVNSASTTLTMPNRDIAISATYSVSVTIQEIKSILTVARGTGSGEYDPGTVVNIEADASPAGSRFKEWTGDISGLGDPGSASTTITIPQSDVSIAATYEAIYTLTVNGGSGAGDYAEGEEVPITADSPSMGKQFTEWSGDVAGIADVAAASTTLTMPAAAVSIEAVYTDLPGTYAITGTWLVEKFYEAVGDGDFSMVNTSANDDFRITFNVDQDYEPTTYNLTAGNALAIPNFNSNLSKGIWEVNSLMNPNKITFDPSGNSSSVINVEIYADASMLVIWWTETNTVDGKPSKTYKMELSPVQ